MKAVDTNVLVYAHRTDSPHHKAARDALEELVTGGLRWGVPWPCVHEFLAVVTHPHIYAPPTEPADAVGAISDLLGLAGATPLPETTGHLDVLADLLRPGIAGPKVHDARIAAICIAHGVEELLTADRDFSYFPALHTRNPMVR